MTDGFLISVNVEADGLIGNALEEYLVEKLGPRIQGNAKRTVPVDLGNLKRAIVVQVERVQDDVTLQVGVDAHAPGITIPEVDYGLYVERGTSKAPAQPYLVPALYQARGTS